MIKKSITHITTVHPRYDTRIYIKECKSVYKYNFDVHLIVADGLGDEVIDGIKIYDIGKPINRIVRILFYRKKAFKIALKLNSDIYHFHDPELIPLGLRLRKLKKEVVYDVHEDVPRQILTKPYFSSFVGRMVSRIFENYENKSCSKFSAIITATPYIRERFLKINRETIEVQNFPFLQEFEGYELNFIKKKKSVCYVGSITKVRGIKEMVKSMEYVDEIRLSLGGTFKSLKLRKEVMNISGWNKVDELGHLERNKVKMVLKESIAGLVVLKPTLNYLDSIPVKMFEYMASGIPVIASDFTYWKELIQDVGCAIFVNPENPKEIGFAIQKLIDNPENAELMGKKGREAVLRKFNWDIEENKLVDTYLKLLNS